MFTISHVDPMIHVFTHWQYSSLITEKTENLVTYPIEPQGRKNACIGHLWIFPYSFHHLGSKTKPCMDHPHNLWMAFDV
jgi:hypothetical protein